MKLILAPTDLSRPARNAVDYAAQIARHTKAKLVLLHAYHPSVVMSEAPIVLPLPEEAEKDCLRQLKKIRYDLFVKHNRQLDIEIVCVRGLATNVILDHAEKLSASLIVSGTHGSSYPEEKLLGSVTSELVARSKTPVLSIPPGVKFKAARKIVLATDYLELSSSKLLDPIREICGLFRSHLYILHILKPGHGFPSTVQAAEGVKLQRVFQEQDHSFHMIINPDVAEGVNSFAEKRRIDLVVMIPRKHSFFKTLFSGHTTKTMVFHTQSPLLTIHN